MAKRGRPANNQPATAYDWRRAIALVQVLALEDNHIALRRLAAAWGIEPPTYDEVKHTGSWTHVMARKLAQRALQQAREE